MTIHIDLYAAHGLAPTSACADIAQQLTRHLDTLDQYDAINRRRVTTARTILSDPYRRATYDGLLADATAHIDEMVLERIASGTARMPLAEQPGSDQAQRRTLTRVVVVPTGIVPKTEYWADHWTAELQDDGATIVLVATGKGTDARKAHKSGASAAEWAAAGAIGGTVGALLGL